MAIEVLDLVGHPKLAPLNILPWPTIPRNDTNVSESSDGPDGLVQYPRRRLYPR
jgi:hypothetical protein